MIRRICLCAGLLMVFSHAALALQPATRAKTPAKPEEIKKAVDRLIQEGEGALVWPGSGLVPTGDLAALVDGEGVGLDAGEYAEVAQRSILPDERAG